MTCEEVQERLPAWLDGEVGASEGAGIVAHLGGCPRCAAEVVLLRRLHGELDGLLAPGPGPGTSAFAPLWQRIEAEERDDLQRAGRRSALGRDRRDGRAPAGRFPGILTRGRWLGVAGSAAAAAAALVLFAQGPRAPIEKRSAAPVPAEVERANRVAHVEEPPEDLRKRAALFLDYPIVVRLEQLQTLEAVLADSPGEGGRG
jgi:anti-sigma factor RsiW